MGHAPERIWLQWHGDADPEIEDGEVSEGDVSWCRDKIFTHDIEYIRADLADAALKAREAATWLPIETAPKMQGVLLWADTSTPDFPNWRMGSGHYQSEMNVWIWEGEQVRNWAHPPTHWMPLPSPPAAAQQKGSESDG